MKKFRMTLKTFLVFIICTVLFLPVNAEYNEEYIEPEHRDTVRSGDWEYYPIGDTVCICGYNGREETITIPAEIDGKAVTKIAGRKNIDKLDGIDTIRFSKSDIFPYTKTVKEVIISEGIISVGIYAFYGSRIEKITLPKSLNYIGFKAFDSCTLTSVIIPENVKYIGESAFGKSTVEEVYLPEGLEYIGESAFEGSQLKQIYIPDTVTVIGQYAFRNTQLEEVTLPKGLLKAERGVLANCHNLKRAYISEGTEILCLDLFGNDKALEEIYFPSTLKSSERILVRNNSLKKLYFAAAEDEYKNPLAEKGESFTDSLIKSEWRTTEGFSDVYGNIEAAYDVPVPLAEPIAYPKEKIELDGVSVLLLIITLLCFILTVSFLAVFLRRFLGITRKKKEALLKDAKEGFHPEVLGVWQCEKCGTPNSPIANYCYKCGRKGGR